MLKKAFLTLFLIQLALLLSCTSSKQNSNTPISQTNTMEEQEEIQGKTIPTALEEMPAVLEEIPKEVPEEYAIQKSNTEIKLEKAEYNYNFTIENTEENITTDPVVKQALQEKILSLTQKNSQLVFLQHEKLQSILSLERYAQNDVGIAITVMKSFGFYSANAKFEINNETTPPTVHMNLILGKQYKVGNIALIFARKEAIPAAFMQAEIESDFLFFKKEIHTIPKFPSNLTKVHKGDAAIATDILNAVDTLAQPLRENGYPMARVTSSSFSVDENTQELNGTVFFNQGLPAIMGEVKLSGNSKVSSQYIQRLRPWKIGARWDERYLLAYRDILQKTGLFQIVKIRFDRQIIRNANKELRGKPQKIGQEIEPVSLLILLDVTESKEKSISGALYYSTDEGPGFLAAWEHRNIFGNGEKLIVNLPLSKDEYLLSTEFRKPAFIHPKQSLILKSAIGHEKTDAYDKDFVEFAAGIEREIRPDWWWESLIYIDKVSPNDMGSGYYEPDYSSVRWANTLRYGSNTSARNSGQDLNAYFKLSPLYGVDSEDFYSIPMEIGASIYYPLSKKLTAGIGMAVGIMPGSDWIKIPRTKRFFLGGGASVRGYSYQELGKHDDNDEPLGGLSYTIINLELLIEVAKDIDIVPFLDGGMVYESVIPKWGKDIAWGAGIGLRYNTTVGPIRFDIAVPLSDASPTNSKSITDFQIYLSIGHTF